MTPVAKIISAADVPALLEEIVALRNPELGRTRRTNQRRQQDRFRRTGSAFPPPQPITITAESTPETIAAAIVGTMRPAKARPAFLGSGILSDQDRPAAYNIAGLNRTLSTKRAKEYFDAMVAGRWLLSPDAIAVTADGFVLNGQHRLYAAHLLMEDIHDSPELEASMANRGVDLPRFILLRGADRRSTLLMDEAVRSRADRRTIAERYAHAQPS